MDIQTVFSNAVAVERHKKFAESKQLTLGELITKLEAVDQSLPVLINNEHAPGVVHSWRGSYNELAIDPSDGVEGRVVADLVSELKEAVGKTFQGYKGGDFLMTRLTPVWVSEYGCSSDDAIVDVESDGRAVSITTDEIEY